MSKEIERCDVHILMVNKNSQFWDQCFESLKFEPVNVHRLMGVEGHIGQGRFLGYGKGNAEFVSYVDDDDYVKPGAFQACMDYLDENPDIAAVCTSQIVMHKESEGFWRVPPVTNPATWTEIIPDRTFPFEHVLVVRRAILDKYRAELANYPIACDRALIALLLGNGHAITQIPYVGYVWRKYNNGMHTRFNEDRSAIAALRRRLRGI